MPSGLPRLPIGAEPVQVIEFGRTGNLYGSFRAASGEPEELLRSTAAELRATGWTPAAGEASPEIGGRVHFSGQMIWGCIQIATNGKKEIEINEAIRDREVRLIGADGSQLGVPA